MNPGSFPPGTTAEDFRKRPHSEPINEVISSVFFKSGLMEAWGRGIPDIFNECKAAGLPAPEFESIPNFVCLTIRFKNPLTPYLTDQNNSSSNETLNGGVNGGVNGEESSISENLKSVLDLIHNTPGIKANQLAEKLDRSINTVEKQLSILRKKMLIEHRGSAKTGGYYAK